MFRFDCPCGREHEVSYGSGTMGGTLKCGCGGWIQWVVYSQPTFSTPGLGQLIFNGPPSQFAVGAGANKWPRLTPAPELPTMKSDLPIIGFRSWQLYKDRLYSNNRQFGYWKQGVNEAKHRPTSKVPFDAIHKAPHPWCDCGIYVLATIERLGNGPWGLYDGTQPVDNQVPLITGAVMGWGKVIAHEPEGWRASHAQIIGLLDTSILEYERITMEGLAEYYKVPLLPSERALKSFAAGYGETLAEKMRPSI